MASLAIVACLYLCPLCCPADTAEQGQPPASVSGVVLDPEGLPVGGREVGLYWAHWPNPRGIGSPIEWGGGELRTGPQGEFELHDVPAGSVKLWAAIPDMLPVHISEPVSVRRGDPTTGLILQSPGYGGTVTGSVIDEEGQPVADAAVVTSSSAYSGDMGGALEAADRQGEQTRTGPDGRFRLTAVRPGERTLRAFAPGWVPATGSVQVAEAAHTGLTLTLRRCSPGTWTLVGRVVDDTGQAVPGAEIEMDYEPEPGGVSYRAPRATTTSLGDFLVYDLPPDKPIYTRVYHPEAGVWRQDDLAGSAGEYRRLNIQLARGAKLRGIARFSDGTPLPDEELDVSLRGPGEDRRHWGGLNFRLKTDEHGSYLIAGLEPGPWEIRAQTGLRKQQVHEAVTIEQRHTRHDIVFPRSAGVAGQVIGPDGKPVPDAWIAFRQPDGGGSGPLWTPDGYFRCGSIAPGKYTVAAWASGFWPSATDVTVPEGQTLTALHLRLGQGPTVSGTVVDADGQPLPGIGVQLAVSSITWADLAQPISRDTYAQWQERSQHLYALLGCMSPGGAATTAADGSFVLRGVSAQQIGLTAAAERLSQAWLPRFWQGPSGPVHPLALKYRAADGTYVAAGAALIDLTEGRDVTGVVIRVAKAVPDRDLCYVRGTVSDPQPHFAGLAGLTVVLAPSPTGWGRGIGPGQPLQAGEHDRAELGEEGAFEIRNAPPGECTLLVGSTDGTYQLAQLELQPGETADLGDLPIPVAGGVEGAVLNAEGQAIGEGVVLAARQESSLFFSAADRESWEGERRPIGGDGTYHFDALGPGFWYLMAVCPSQPAAGIGRIFVNGGTQRLDFRHSYSGRITGRVIDTEGRPVANARVNCSGRTLKSSLETETDENGYFETGGLPNGSYTVEPRYQWSLRTSGEKVTVDESTAPASVEFAVELGGYIEGALLGPDSQPVRAGSERFDVQSGPPWIGEPQSAWLMDDGTIRSRLLKPGTYRLRAREKGAAEDAPWVESELVGVYAGQATTDAVIELPMK